MHRFEDIARKVAELPTGLWGWVAFAATCAERLLPFYTCYAKQKVSGADNYLAALDYVWGCLGVMRFDPQDAQRLLAECEKTLPDEDGELPMVPSADIIPPRSGIPEFEKSPPPLPVAVSAVNGVPLEP